MTNQITFEQFNFHNSINAAIKAQGFTSPTPIQAKAIPVVLDKKDVLGIAQTGTGKTAAFVLPILERLIATKSNKIRAVIIAPTRELAVQIDQVIRELGAKTGLKSTTIFGGVSMNAQVQRLRDGVDIVVACPGRLLDHLRQKTINLSAVEVLVLDEADQMFDMGFLPAIRQIVRFLPVQRQSLLFSATMPAEIRSLAVSVLKNPVSVDIGNRAPLTTIAHALYPVSQNLKTEFLLALFKQIEISSVIIFTRTKHGAKRLAEKLGRTGYGITSLQGNLSQNRRQEAMEGFRKGKYKVLVATDIAARGIDISTVSHVINFDMPSTAEAYTHRIGRTGRASRTGEAYTLTTSEDGQMIRSIEKILGQSLERRKLEGFKYDAAPEPRLQANNSNNFKNREQRNSPSNRSGSRRNTRPQSRNRNRSQHSKASKSI
jgi:ATP-dependent RNA helicase RhlE